MYRYVSFGLLVAVTLILVFVFYQVMASFILPLFLAALLVVIFRPVHQWCLRKLDDRRKLSALATTGIIMLIVLLPLSLLTILAAAESRVLVSKINASLIGNKFSELRTQLNLDMPASAEFEDVDFRIRAAPVDPNSTQTTTQLLDLSDDIEDLESGAKRLGQALGLSWSEPTDDNARNNTGENSIDNESWRNFNSGINTLKELLKNVDYDDQEARRNAIDAYLESRNSVVAAYMKFKMDLLGGRTWAWLKEYANPSEQELSGYLYGLIDFLRTRLLSFGGATTAFIVRALVGTAIMIIALYFFLVDGPAMLAALKRLSPLDDAHEDKLIQEFDSISRAVVLATLLSAIAQGVLAAIGFYFAGIESVILLMLLTTLLAMVPFVGAAAVWVPVCFYLYIFEGRLGAAILLALYGGLIISMADNVIKPLVLHGQSNLHPLWALLSVLGGVAALGPIGILVGPMVVAFLQTLLKILQREMTSMKEREVPDRPSRYQLLRPTHREEYMTSANSSSRLEITESLTDH